MRHTLARRTRRARAYRELEQIRADINGCAAISRARRAALFDRFYCRWHQCPTYLICTRMDS
jgi:hypothetical protein